MEFIRQKRSRVHFFFIPRVALVVLCRERQRLLKVTDELNLVLRLSSDGRVASLVFVKVEQPVVIFLEGRQCDVNRVVKAYRSFAANPSLCRNHSPSPQFIYIRSVG